MYRVELKGQKRGVLSANKGGKFLMYRVELKDFRADSLVSPYLVPNVPCGVESLLKLSLFPSFYYVPNVPCGVESCYYLVHYLLCNRVPNVPCGVERSHTLPLT